MSHVRELLTDSWMTPTYKGPTIDPQVREHINFEYRAAMRESRIKLIGAQHFTMPADLSFKGGPYEDNRVWKIGNLLDKSVHLPFQTITISSKSKDIECLIIVEEVELESTGEWPSWIITSFEKRPEEGMWRAPYSRILIEQDDKQPWYAASMLSRAAQAQLDSPPTQVILDSMGFEIHMLFSLLVVLNNQPANAYRQAKSKRLCKTSTTKNGRKRTTKHTFKELIINTTYNPTRSCSTSIVIPTGITQRAHTRRGHERHYKNGKVIWIDSYTAGDASKGTIDKDYRVEA